MRFCGLSLKLFHLIRRARKGCLSREKRPSPRSSPTHNSGSQLQFGNVRYWLGFPLIASDTVLGLLPIGCAEPWIFTIEHFRWRSCSRFPRPPPSITRSFMNGQQIHAKEGKTPLEKVDAAKSVLGEAQGPLTPRLFALFRGAPPAHPAYVSEQMRDGCDVAGQRKELDSE